MRKSWTDERLDDFRGETARRFDEGKADIRDVKTEIRAMRGELHADITALHRAVLQVGGGLFATFVIGFLGVLAAML